MTQSWYRVNASIATLRSKIFGGGTGATKTQLQRSQGEDPQGGTETTPRPREQINFHAKAINSGSVRRFYGQSGELHFCHFIFRIVTIVHEILMQFVVFCGSSSGLRSLHLFCRFSLSFQFSFSLFRCSVQ